MTQVRVEIEGSADEVVRVLQHLGSPGQHATTGGAGSMEESAGSGDDAAPSIRTQGAAGSRETATGEWTEALAGEFLAGLEPAAPADGAAGVAGRCGGHP